MSTLNDPRSNAYLQTQVMSATPEELRLMLIDGAIKFATMGRAGLASGDHEKSYEGFSQARAIITELMTSMRTDVAPELCERVRSLYSFLFTELVTASMERDIARADKVIELLGYERETWVLLMEQIKAERASGNAAPVATGTPDGPAPDAGYRPLSVQG